MRLLIAAAGLVAAAVVGVRVFGLRAMLAWAERPIGGGALSEGDIRARAVAVQRAARVLPRATCLPQSLALARMLRKKGVAANVRIGVKAGSGFAAHAWIEIDGRPLGGLRDDLHPDLGGYVPMDLHRHR